MTEFSFVFLVALFLFVYVVLLHMKIGKLSRKVLHLEKMVDEMDTVLSVDNKSLARKIIHG